MSHDDTAGGVWAVGPYVLDEVRFEIRRNGKPVPTQRHVLELLFFLVRSEGRLVTKRDLMQGPWKGTVVTGAALHRGIMLARRALAGAGDEGHPIATVRGKGFRFVARVEVVSSPSHPAPLAAPLAPERSRDSELAAIDPRGPLVGRSTEIAKLRRLWEDARAGRGGVALVTGPLGIGKTRLVEDLARWVDQQGARVVWGRAWEAGGAPPFWPWLEVVRDLVRSSDASEAEELRRARRDVAALLDDDAGDDVARTRFRVFASIRCLLEHASRSEPLLVLIEDLHLADDASVLLLRFLVRALPFACPLLVVATSLDAASDRAALDPLLAGTAERVERLAVSGLSHGAIDHLVRALVPCSLSPAALAAVHDVTEGNPLLVETLARAGAIARFEKAADLGSVEPLPVPERIGRAIRESLDRLPPRTRDLLAIGAVLGRTFQVMELADLGSLSAAEAASALESAIGAGLIQDRASDPGRYRFHHAVIRELLYRDLPSARRHAIHAAIAEYLERSLASDQRLLSRLAHHAAAAVPVGDHEKAIRLSARAAEQAQRRMAYELASEHYRRVMGLLAASVPSDARKQREVLMALAATEALSGRSDEAFCALEEAMNLARSASDPDAFADAVLACFDLVKEAAAARPAFHTKVREALADRVHDDPRKARLLSVTAFLGHFHTPYEARFALVEEAIAIARASDDDTLRSVLRASHFSILHPSKTAHASELAREITERSRAQRCLVGEMEGLFWEAQHALDRGDGDAFRRASHRHAELASEVRHPTHVWYASLLECTRLFLDGQLEKAEAILRAAPSRAEPALGSTAVESSVGGHLLTLAWHTEGEARRVLLKDARELGRRVLDAAPVFTVWRLVGEVIDRDLAAADSRADVECWLSAIPDDAHFLLCLALLAHEATRAPNERVLRILYERLLPYSDLHVSVMTLAWGPVVFHLGTLAEALGDDRRAAALYEDAIVKSRRAGSLPWERQAERALARVHAFVSLPDPSSIPPSGRVDSPRRAPRGSPLSARAGGAPRRRANSR